MTKLEIERLLRRAGFVKFHGGKHDIWQKAGFPPITLPRHKGDIKLGTARSILQTAGIEVKK